MPDRSRLGRTVRRGASYGRDRAGILAAHTTSAGHEDRRVIEINHLAIYQVRASRRQPPEKPRRPLHKSLGVSNGWVAVSHNRRVGIRQTRALATPMSCNCLQTGAICLTTARAFRPLGRFL